MDLYGYVLNDPVNAVDPEGLAPSACEDDNCRENALKEFKDCMTITGAVQAACLTKCAVICVPAAGAGGIGYLVCLKTCAIACTVGTIPTRVFCLVRWLNERSKCSK